MTNKQIKRLILALVTFVVLLKVLLSLLDSFSQPQAQSNLELYQTNLVLHGAEVQVEQNIELPGAESPAELEQLSQALLGENPYQNAQQQYEKARQETETNWANLQTQLQKITAINLGSSEESVVASLAEESKSQQQIFLLQAIGEAQKSLDKLDVRIGILQAQQGDRQAALDTWNSVRQSAQADESRQQVREVATILSSLWSESPLILPDGEVQLEAYLDSWFRYRALRQLYEVQGKQAQLAQLQTQEQVYAQQAILKLSLIGAIPLVGGIGGVSLLIFLGVQWFAKKEQSLLAAGGTPWETPWDGEIIWQVMIVGFFFISQIVLPIIFSVSLALLGLDPSTLGLKAKAISVLISYLLMALGGLLVLYFSLKPFLPLSTDWFRFKGDKNWILWGFGGYLVALPLVVIVSWLNQQIWQGQGGSNPIISLALEAQDTLALAIFFFTASIAAPVFEEIIFRGFLLPSLTRYLPVWTSIVVSSFVFAIAHLSLSEVLPLTTLGIMLGFVYTRSRNILAPMLLHSLWNGGTLLSLFVLGSGVS